jgi:hypothetical protein
MRSMANIVVSRLAESAITLQNVSCAASSVGVGFPRRRIRIPKLFPAVVSSSIRNSKSDNPPWRPENEQKFRSLAPFFVNQILLPNFRSMKLRPLAYGVFLATNL